MATPFNHPNSPFFLNLTKKGFARWRAKYHTAFLPQSLTEQIKRFLFDQMMDRIEPESIISIEVHKSVVCIVIRDHKQLIHLHYHRPWWWMPQTGSNECPKHNSNAGRKS